jgi:hypothetical protein
MSIKNMYEWWRLLTRSVNNYKHQHNITNPNYVNINTNKNYITVPNQVKEYITKYDTLDAPVFLNTKEYIELPKNTINRFIWINIINPLAICASNIRNITYVGFNHS